MKNTVSMMQDIAYTLDCIADDLFDDGRVEIINRSNGYWDSVEHCRSNAKANADYIGDFIEDTLAIDDDMQVFILEQLARIVEAYRIMEHE